MYESLVESAVASAVSQIARYDSTQLNKLLNDDAAIDDLVKELPQLTTVNSEREMLQAQNKSLAEHNLSQEPVLRTAKDRLLETYRQGVVHKERYEGHKEKLASLADNKSLDSTLALLRTAAAETEEEAEKLKDRFLAKEVEVEKFLELYLQLRELAHLRRLKAEKLREIMLTATAEAGGRPLPAVPGVQPHWPRDRQSSLWNQYPTF